MHSLETLHRLNAEAAERELAVERGRLTTRLDRLDTTTRERVEIRDRLHRVRARLLELAVALALLPSCGGERQEPEEPVLVHDGPPYGPPIEFQATLHHYPGGERILVLRKAPD